MPPWHNPKCSRCEKPLYVTFTKTDGRQSRQTRIARGTTTVEVHIKEATHSSKHFSLRVSSCAECAADSLILQLQEVQAMLLDPGGFDPPRKGKSGKTSARLFRCPCGARLSSAGGLRRHVNMVCQRADRGRAIGQEQCVWCGSPLPLRELLEHEATCSVAMMDHFEPLAGIVGRRALNGTAATCSIPNCPRTTYVMDDPAKGAYTHLPHSPVSDAERIALVTKPTIGDWALAQAIVRGDPCAVENCPQTTRTGTGALIGHPAHWAPGAGPGDGPVVAIFDEVAGFKGEP